MSYFVFNGIHSDDMKIIVEKLPPIVKPPKRYNKIEIDGSNRTIIEELGYQAYEKLILFGLREDNLDMVYDWLQGSGRLTTSDEPDKYYDAAILDQIDYERALRFRKAKATFLVQPYKHALFEEPTESLTVVNKGNVYSLPKMTIYANSSVGVYVNGVKACSLVISDYLTIDSETQECYRGTELKNRMMIGDFPRLRPGINTISFTGTVTNCITEVRSRWT